MLGQKPLILSVGDKVHYKNINMVHPEATYEGVVTEVCKHFYRVLGTPIRSTLNILDKKELWGPATPYHFCIPKYLDTTIERVKVVNDEIETLSA